jgi:hypothetical protein
MRLPSTPLKMPAAPRVGPRTVASALLIVLAARIIVDIFRRKPGAAAH